MFSLTYHASLQCQERGIAEDLVLSVVNGKAEQISRIHDDWEVKVVVARLSHKVSFPDGSNGDTVIACVDQTSRRVKTVMFQRWSQVSRKMRSEAYV